VAERILKFAEQFFVGRSLPVPPEDGLLVRILLSFYVKILVSLWSIAVLSERGLPTATITRELFESMISATYIAADHSPERARLYMDYLAVREAKDLRARLGDPRTQDVDIPERRAAIQSHEAEVTARRGPDYVTKMRKWSSWAGDFSLETMAQRTTIDVPMYNLGYRHYSRATHGLDVLRYTRLHPDGRVEPIVPDQVEENLMAACAWILIALLAIGQKLGVDRSDELHALMAEVERVM
jgi:hypothetical protein